MKRKVFLQVLVLTVFVFGNAFSKTNEQKTESIYASERVNLELSVGEIIVEKTTTNELDIYTFIPEKVLDTQTISAIENRFKVVVEGFVSLSVEDGNKIKLITDNTTITPENEDFLLSVTIKLYEYANYKIKE
ncbi:MAG: hypothetical protein WCY06_03640 [Flavobacteriaceae bacterium]